MTGSRRFCPDLGAFQPPTLETLPEAVARNVAIARARTRARIMAVVKADGYGHGACTVAQAAVAAGAEWLGTTDIAEASELRAIGLTVPILTWLNPSGVDARGRCRRPEVLALVPLPVCAQPISDLVCVSPVSTFARRM